MCITESFVLLLGGHNLCEGRVSLFIGSEETQFAQACDQNAGDAEVQVICRQIGCNPVGAKKMNPTV